MELETARLTLLVATHGKEALEQPCALRGTASQGVRRPLHELARQGA